MLEGALRLKELPEPCGVWTEDRWIGRNSTLRDGDRLLGRFRLEGWMGKQAALQTAAGTWRMNHHAWRGRWVVEPAAGSSGRLVYEPGLFGRRPMTIAAGPELRFRTRSLWRGVWAWCRGDDEVVRFERRRQFPHSAFMVRWDRELRDWPELDALLGLGWWILRERRSHSSAH